MSNDIKRRLSALEKVFVPPELWKMHVQYADGTEDVISAKQLLALKEQDPESVVVLDFRASGYLPELDCYLKCNIIDAHHFIETEGGTDEQRISIL